MAAPASAYLNKNINTISATGQQVANYRAIPTDSPEVLKDRFYLDAFLTTKDADGNEGFSGLCTVNGVNSVYHRTDRIGSLRVNNNGQTQQNYVDAGLNTLAPPIGLPTLTNGVGAYINLVATFKSAWYLNTTPIIRYRIQGEPNWNETQLDVIPSGGVTVARSRKMIWQNLTTNQTIELQSINRNDEGDMYSAVNVLNISNRQYIYNVYMTDACGNPSSTFGQIRTSDYTLAIGAEVNGSGGLVFEGAHFVVSPDGDGSDGQDIAGVEGLVYTMSNQAGGSFKITERKPLNWCNTNPPIPTYTVYTFKYRTNVYTQGCTFLNQNPNTNNEIKVYYSTLTGRYHDSPPSSVNDTNYTPNGLYYTSNTDFQRFTNGYQTGQGNCTDGIYAETIE